ncbi:MAG: hypothetical protein PVH37_22405 [Desulfobacterales bacterium]|jgi:hypothetical protein
MIVLFSIFVLKIFSSSALAGDSTMQRNCKNLSELTSKWSKQLSSGKLTPEAQQKLAGLLSLTSKVLQDMSEKTGEQMHMENSMKIKKMKSEWDPFDTYGGN